ncbi:AimR family lysis-lysogeny pheromone receptor [Geobacillus thermodenitrificans]|jgi:hypothetical protein|uniref:AimR family lysis-lysogeny pheromone receptor n=1 Tax=Geobacillus thermodenitrificans TaxID=33940 RepID=UPI003D1DA75A
MAVKLKQMIKNKLEEDKTLANKLAKLAGFANATPIYKFLNEENREMNDFESLLTIVRELFHNEEYKLMDEYLRQVDPNKKTARIGLEYATINHMYDLKKYLIEAMESCNNKESKEFAYFYKMDDIASKENDKDVLLGFIDKYIEYAPKTKEMMLFSKLCQIYVYYDLRLIDIMYQLLMTVENKIDEITDLFLKKSYKKRIALLFSGILLHKGEIEKSREYAKYVIENQRENEEFSMIYMKLGNSYMFEDFDKAKIYLEKGLSQAKEKYLVKKNIERSLNFLCNYWGYKPEYLNFNSNEVEDLHEVIFFFINQNEKEKAKELLSNIDLNRLTEHQKGFHYYLIYKIDNDVNHLYESLISFKKCGEHFYKNIALIELKKLGLDDNLLKALSI